MSRYVPENASGKRHLKPSLGNVSEVASEPVSEKCLWKRAREMILDRKHPGKVLWKTCELQGLGGVFHTSSNPRHSGKNVAEETSPNNVPGKCLWGRGCGRGTCRRIWKRRKARPQKGLWQNVSGKMCPKKVPEAAHETRLRKPSLATDPKTTCPDTSPKTRQGNVTEKRAWGTSLKSHLNPRPKNVSGNVPGK